MLTEIFKYIIYKTSICGLITNVWNGLFNRPLCLQSEMWKIPSEYSALSAPEFHKVDIK